MPAVGGRGAVLPPRGNRRSTEPYCPHGAIGAARSRIAPARRAIGGVGIVLPPLGAIDAEQIILTLICDIYFVYKMTMESVII